MLVNILGSLFFLSIIVCIISIVLAIANFFKRKKIGKLKYILIFSLAIMVISFLGFGLNYNPTPEQQARISRRKQEKEEQRLKRQEEKEQNKQEREKQKLEEQKKQEKKEEQLVEQQEKEQIQKDEEVFEENITKTDEEIKITENDTELNETKTSEITQDTTEQKIITATKKIFGEENYINVFYEPEDNFVLIKAKGKDLLSSSMSAKGMLKSIKDTLYEIREIPDLNVDFNIVYTMVNSAGDTSDDIVIKATYKNETRNSINWDEYVLHEDMPKIADEWWAHTAIQKALEE